MRMMRVMRVLARRGPVKLYHPLTPTLSRKREREGPAQREGEGPAQREGEGEGHCRTAAGYARP